MTTTTDTAARPRARCRARRRQASGNGTEPLGAQAALRPGPVSPAVGEASCPPRDLGVLEEIARRVLWLAVRIVDAANRERDTGDGVKVGGHQASCASWSR